MADGRLMSLDPGRAATLQQNVGETNGAQPAPLRQLEGSEKRLKLQQFTPPLDILEESPEPDREAPRTVSRRHNSALKCAFLFGVIDPVEINENLRPPRPPCIPLRLRFRHGRERAA